MTLKGQVKADDAHRDIGPVMDFAKEKYSSRSATVFDCLTVSDKKTKN